MADLRFSSKNMDKFLGFSPAGLGDGVLPPSRELATGLGGSFE
jgi:hypothetical protein